MQIDKKNGNVCFCESSHTYWDKEQPDRKFISVTTLIEKYGQPFDKEFWSGYKALERIMTPEQFGMEKGHLLETKKIDINEISETYGVNKLDFNKAQQDILDEWQKSNIESCERGTKIHAALEQSFTENKTSDLQKFGIGGKFVVNTNESLEIQKETLLSIDKGIFPEFLVYSISKDGKVCLAGQIDLLVKDGDDIYIIDYKTNKKLNFTSGYDKFQKKNIKMQYPLNNLDDCNMSHYTLQLSTYAWMLQKINPNFKVKKLLIEHHAHDGSVNQYEIEYKKDEVERMLRDYKKKLILKERADSRKPIVF